MDLGRKTLRLITLLGCLGILLFTSVLDGQYTMIISFVLLLLVMLPSLLRFETKLTDARQVVLMALLAAAAAVARVPFAALPSIQPTSFIIIVTGLVFGAETGFMVGSTAAFVSNFFLGHGPWTPWQMFAWGSMGFTAGLLKDTVMMRSMPGKLVFGFIWGILFGWIMNLWFLIGFMLENFNLNMVITSFAASFYFDLMHALANVCFLLLFASSWMNVLSRFRRKLSGTQVDNH